MNTANKFDSLTLETWWFYLDEANLLGVAAEALSAAHNPVLSDQPMRVPAHATAKEIICLISDDYDWLNELNCNATHEIIILKLIKKPPPQGTRKSFWQNIYIHNITVTGNISMDYIKKQNERESHPERNVILFV